MTSDPHLMVSVVMMVVGEEQRITGLAAVNDEPTRLGDTTTLTATVPSGTNVRYEWGFRDGNVGAGAIVGHVYEATRTYTAKVTATDSLGF